MKNKKDLIIKLIILILFIIMISIIVVIVLFLKKDGTGISLGNVFNNIDSNTLEQDSNIVFEGESNIEDTENIINNPESKRLKLVQNDQIYLLLKQCMEKYYVNDSFLLNEGEEETEENTDFTDNLWYLVDEEAKKDLNLNLDNIYTIHELIEFPLFCIDEIYEQTVNQNSKIYLVYHRIEVDGEQKQNKVILIKIDSKNNTYSVYPYEYLQAHNYVGLKENDVINISNTQEIKENEINNYNIQELDNSDYGYIKEFFERYKFDLQLDLEHLYSLINSEYKNMHFPSYDEFKAYIENNKSEFVLDSLERYRISDADKYKEYTGIGKNGRCYIFDAKNLLDYTILLDGYSVLNYQYVSLYAIAMPEGKGRFCIDRIISAINDKNYQFVYDKLNVIQKNNYYSNYEDFKNFITRNFFEKNEFEIQEDGKTISEDAYQFLVKVTNEDDKTSSRLFTISIFLKDNADFELGISI